MKVLNFGSLNIDYVYGVEHFVRPGETLSSNSYAKNIGGKGLNQSIALVRAGVPTYHAGKIGQDGQFLLQYLRENGVNVEHVLCDGGESGHAIIQVDKSGQNCILLNGGANQRLTPEEIDAVLAHFGKGDWLVLQNEINNVGYIIESAHAREIKIAVNVAPVNGREGEYDFSKVDMINVNETEGEALTGKQKGEDIINVLAKKYPDCMHLVTLGSAGSMCYHGEKLYRQGIFKVQTVDTTSAGDTFFGYFLSEYFKSGNVQNALRLGALASAVCVARAGASQSIPYLAELE